MPDSSSLSLSSDILEQQFGPTEVKVLYQDETTRITCTRAVGSRQVLELSQVDFVGGGARQFPKTHQSVLQGKSIGKAFKTDGIKFSRREQAAYRYALPASFGRWFGDDNEATFVAVAILVGSGDTLYAEILETYSPAVQWPRLHGQPTAGQLNKLGLLDKFLSANSSSGNDM